MPDISLTLVSNPLCPFVQRAAIVLLEKGIPFEQMPGNFSTPPISPPLMRSRHVP
ncbi:glutathione-S-transferase (plasmid) [Rhizobium sp. CCGE 510]|nr:glutathione-S-transferase [Rhizobium sp. CCGE 510]